MNDLSLFPPGRGEALTRLENFLPAAGKNYARTRNTDKGSLEANGVSGLSPYLRRRVLTEGEVCEAVVRAHGEDAAEKFLQEVCWRTYWKGWLELRPSVWSMYTRSLADRQRQAEVDRELGASLAAALDGETDYACFNHWVRELRDTGYLHNHSRMWFAGIWIYALGLPWELGADFFARNLLDGDPASNTLSWRWVAGLHTRGKRYKPRASNIRRYTGGRFEELRDIAWIHDGPEYVELPKASIPEMPAGELPESFSLLLCADDWAMDLPEALRTGTERVILLWMDAWPPTWSPADHVRAFEAATRADVRARWSEVAEVEEMSMSEFEAAWPEMNAAETVMPTIPTGPRKDRLEEIWTRTGARPATWIREWDRHAWPCATAGFFRFWKKCTLISDCVTSAS